MYGIPTAGITVKDGSGLSRDNAVPPAYVAALMSKVLAGKQNLEHHLQRASRRREDRHAGTAASAARAPSPADW